MNTYKVWITGAYKVAAFVNANSPAEAEKQAEELSIEKIEELIYNQGIDWGWKIASEALPECKVGYIAKANGDLFHRFFESKGALLRHLDERQQVLYNNAVKWDELFDWFYARNYFRAV
jgi:hypothetical protein